MLYLPPPANRAEWQAPNRRIPDAWLAEAAAWLAGGASATADLHGRVVNVEFPAAIGDAQSVLRRAGARRLELVAGNLGEPIRRAAVNAPHMVLAGGGPAADDDELVTMANTLIDVARRLAGDVGYAVVSMDPVFSTRAISDWWGNHGGELWDIVEELCDEYVIDAFPYQVLGPGHLAHLRRPPVDAETLAGGRFGLAIGEPRDWLVLPLESPYQERPSDSFLCDRRRNPSITEHGRQLLAACMLLRDEEGSRLRARLQF